VEAGAQGEHKIQRGYLPSLTHSSHYIRDPLLRAAIDKFLQHEQRQIEYTIAAMQELVSPYK
jgi:predicted N-acyltransferase